MKIINSAKKMIPCILILVMMVSIFAFCDSINFGPVNALNKAIDEYKEHKGENNKSNPNHYGTISGAVTSPTGSPMTYTIVYLDGNTWAASSDNSGNYTISSVSPGYHTIFAKTNYGDLNSRSSLSYSITVTAGQTLTQNIVFDWVTLSSPLSGTYSDFSKLAANTTYTVTGNVTFSSDLLVESGVIIKFSGYSGFYAEGGSCSLNGTASSHILFTSGRSSPASGDYASVYIGQWSSPINYSVSMNYVDFQYGSGEYIGGNSSSTIRNCIYNTNSGNMNIYTYGTISNCNFGSSYIWSTSGTSISYCNISGEINGLSSAGQYSINNCNLTASGTKLSNSANWTVDATNNWWGVTSSTTIASYISSTAGTVKYTPYRSSTVTNAGPQ